MSLPDITRQNKLKKNAATASVALAGVLIVLKSFGVFYTGSLAVLSSVIDSMADLFASAVTYVAVRVSSHPADSAHRYGHGKAEALSALLQAAFITGSGLFVLYDGVRRFFYPQTLEQTGFGIGIMTVSLILTLALIVFQRYVAEYTNSQAIRADAAHYTVDVITNVSIILTLMIVTLSGLGWFDTLAAIAVATYLLLNAYKLAKNAVALLMDKELDDSIREKIEKLVLNCSHVEGLHDLRTRDLGGQYMFELHLELDGELTLFEAHKYSDEVENRIRQIFPNAQIIIHQDPAGLFEKRLDAEIAPKQNKRI